MPMQVKEYETVMSVVRKHIGFSMDLMDKLRERFPTIDELTLYCIVVLYYQYKMKMNFIKTVPYINKYYSQYEDGVKNKQPPGVILRIAQEADVCPSLIAKLILQKHFSNDHKQLSHYLRDTTLINDPKLAYEVFLCTIYDDIYGPIVDSVKNSLGQQYEIQLYRRLTELGLAFRDEDHLRKFGYDKTPDIKLEVPVAIDGFIIHWIESKALFADEEVHKEYEKHQFSSYWNRFGPGMVIYWFGYLETLQKENKQYIIRDCMPSNILHIIPSKTKDTGGLEEPMEASLFV